MSATCRRLCRHANVERVDRCILRPGLAAGRPRASSLSSYRRDLEQWAHWLLDRQSSLLGAERTDVEAYLAGQFRAKAKATSIARRLSSLRRFYALQLQQGTLRADPTLRVRAPKLPRRLPKSLSEAKVEALLAAPDTETTLGLRDRAMLETLYATGLRVSELVGLTLAQVSLDMGVVRVLGKGSKERLVPLGEESIVWLKRYLATSRASLIAQGKSKALFVTSRGGPLTRQAFWALLKRLGAKAGIASASLSPHVLAARVRDAPFEPRRRSARRAASARPRRHHDDDDLHACGAGAPEKTACGASSARLAAHRPPRAACTGFAESRGHLPASATSPSLS